MDSEQISRVNEVLFQSFFMGGFECSCHRLRSGKRLDLLASTKHTQHIVKDYQRLQQQGLFTARTGIRWPCIETSPGHYDFSSVRPMMQAARQTGMQLIWDLCHYGWPDDIDIFRPDFIRRFTGMVTSFAQVLANETDAIPFIIPINEISFFAWAGGDVAYLNPFQHGRGHELKTQLVRATIEAIEAIWGVLPQARIIHADPVINVVADPNRPHEHEAAEAYRMSQYQAWDMLCGRMWPQLGGEAKYLDIIGVNYYFHNQWILEGPKLDRHHSLYKPFRDILKEVYERYRRPMFVAETGAEGDDRPAWFRYVCQEAQAAIQAKIPLHGICLYPILNHPGWDDDRHCPNGLWDYADEAGEREIYEPLAQELRRQQYLFQQMVPKPASAKPANGKAGRLPSASKRDKPTLCLFTDSHEPSGMGEHMLILAAELISRYDILFVCPATQSGQSFLNRAEALGCKVLALDVSGEGVDQYRLYYRLRSLTVDIFHGHAGIGWEGHEGIHTARKAGIPLVIRTEHLPYLLTDPQQRLAHQTLIEAVDRLVCVSEEARKSFLKANIPAEKLSVIRNGILPPSCRSTGSDIRDELSLSAEARLILTVARMTEQKGHRYLLEAVPQVLDREPEAHFIWVGEGPLSGELRQQVQSLGLDRSVHLIGQRNDVPKLLKSADLFVLPSLFEGLPLVILEAMALETPVVATRVCGSSEAVADEITGRLVPPQDPPALARAILEVLEQPQLAASWRKNGYQRFKQEFSAGRMAREVTELYRTLRLRQVTPVLDMPTEQIAY